MEFFIKQNSTEPKLKLRLIDDGRNDKSYLNDLLENSDITFEMFNVETNEYKVLEGECQITNKIKKFNFTTDEYFIIYNFTTENTNQIGRFEGQIKINFLNPDLSIKSTLIVPIREKLFINVV